MLVVVIAAGCGGRQPAAPLASASPSPAPVAVATSEPTPSETGAPRELATLEVPTPSAPATIVPPTPTVTLEATLEGDRFISPADGFAVTFPQAWTVDIDQFGLRVVGIAPRSSTVPFSPNVGVFLEDLTDTGVATLEQYHQVTLDNLPNLVSDATTVRDETTMLGGEPARLLEFTGSQEDLALRFLVVFAVRSQRAYSLTYTADVDRYATLLGDAEAVVASWTWL